MSSNSYIVDLPTGLPEAVPFQVMCIWNLLPTAPPAAYQTRYVGQATTWQNRHHLIAGDCYHGTVGLLILNDIMPEELTFKLSGVFGVDGEYLEWLSVAEIIGQPIYPTRDILETRNSFNRTVMETSIGKIKSTKKSKEKVFMGRISCKSDEIYIAQIFEMLDELDSSFTIWPCGIDIFPKRVIPIFRRPGFGKIIDIQEYTGPMGYAGGLSTGYAMDISLSFKEAIR